MTFLHERAFMNERPRISSSPTAASRGSFRRWAPWPRSARIITARPSSSADGPGDRRLRVDLALLRRRLDRRHRRQLGSAAHPEPAAASARRSPSTASMTSTPTAIARLLFWLMYGRRAFEALPLSALHNLAVVGRDSRHRPVPRRSAPRRHAPGRRLGGPTQSRRCARRLAARPVLGRPPCEILQSAVPHDRALRDGCPQRRRRRTPAGAVAHGATGGRTSPILRADSDGRKASSRFWWASRRIADLVAAVVASNVPAAVDLTGRASTNELVFLAWAAKAAVGHRQRDHARDRGGGMPRRSCCSDAASDPALVGQRGERVVRSCAGRPAGRIFPPGEVAAVLKGRQTLHRDR